MTEPRTAARLRRSPWLWIASAILLVSLAGCGGGSGDDAQLLRAAYEKAQAYNRGQTDEWPEARALVKRYLVKHPDSAAGHLIYGRSYLRVPEAGLNLTIAHGELETALALFEASRDLGPLADVWTEGQFEGHIHHELATVYMRRIHALGDSRLAGSLLVHDLEAAERHVIAGLQADPDSESLQQMSEVLRKLIAASGKPPAQA